jgi:hypothetical protein
MGRLCLHAAMVLYRRRDVSLLKPNNPNSPTVGILYTSTTSKKTPSSPNSSHRILHTQSPYHHPSLRPANTHAVQQNNLSIASASGLAQHHRGPNPPL